MAEPDKSNKADAAEAEASEEQPIKKIIPKITLKPKPLPVKRDEIILAEYQKIHVSYLSNILDRYPLAMDFSMLGSGKTYTSSFIGLNHPLNFRHIIVICPLSLKPKWNYMAEKYKLPIHTIETYNAMRAVKCHQPKHGLLQRLDYKQTITKKDNTTGTIEKVEFKSTETMDAIVKEGTLLIIDEFQHIKNLSAQYHACQALIETIVGSFIYGSNKYPINRSRVLLMSGSPIDKEEQITHLYRLIGIMKEAKLSQINPWTGENTWTGFLDVINTYKYICSPRPGKMATDRELYEMLSTYDIYIPAINHGSAGEFKKVCYAGFQFLLKPVISSSMKLFETQCSINKFNAFYDIHSEDDRELLSESIKKLRTALSFESENNTITFGHNGSATLSAVSASLLSVETAKIGTMLRIAQEKLQDPRLKMIICVNYTATIDDLVEGLKEYNPLVLQGKTKEGDRGTIISEFAEDNGNRRLLLANLKVCSSGIDLDDKVGGRPRFCLVSPNYSSIDLYQLSHRFLRMDTKSSATVHMMYAKTACELAILNALAKKSAVMKQTTNVQVESGVVFPCDYDSFIEESDLPVCPEVQKYINGEEDEYDLD